MMIAWPARDPTPHQPLTFFGLETTRLLNIGSSASSPVGGAPGGDDEKRLPLIVAMLPPAVPWL